MLVVDKLLNAALYSHHAAVWHLSVRAGFSELKVSFVPSIMPMLKIIRRNTKAVVTKSMSDYRFTFVHKLVTSGLTKLSYN